jgi:DNA repair ATPase RecN
MQRLTPAQSAQAELTSASESMATLTEAEPGMEKLTPSTPAEQAKLTEAHARMAQILNQKAQHHNELATLSNQQASYAITQNGKNMASAEAKKHVLAAQLNTVWAQIHSTLNQPASDARNAGLKKLYQQAKSLKHQLYGAAMRHAKASKKAERDFEKKLSKGRKLHRWGKFMKFRGRPTPVTQQASTTPSTSSTTAVA